ncbi:MAG: patatin-like phospholipase family protein [Candidatus Eisenbacteria bacterium]
MTEPRPSPRREDLPFRRIALVLSGGGALGAYEVGVLKVLEMAGIRPAILAGVSVGAVNAVLWLANGFRTEPLVRVWAALRASSVGMRWLTLMVRALGAFVATLAGVQILLTVAGSHELSPGMLFLRPDTGHSEVEGAVLDVLAWLLVAMLGVIIIRASRSAEDWLARLSSARDPHRLHRWYGWMLAMGTAAHLGTWVAGIAWPHRFSASLLLVGALLWVANRPGRTGDRTRRLFLRLLPETGGRGLWGSHARRRVIQRVVAEGDPGALVGAETHLIISACAIGSGQMGYFVNWPDPSAAFRGRIAASVGEVIPLRTPEEVIEAAVASSAIPVVFEPVRVGAREFVDGGVFANQPLHAVLADDADAIIVVLVSSSGGPPKPRREPNLLELAARLLEIANWRDLQAELRALPAGWSPAPPAARQPARVCVVEPDRVLPGGLYGFSPGNAADLQRLGERDARRALAAAGWLADAAAGAGQSSAAAPPPPPGA